MSRSAKNYRTALQNLNAEQLQAVEQLDGAVVVVAGPGTGKTELLATRAAHILEKTDTNAAQILCLTFTDNAARNMRERVTSLIGVDAQRIAVHTFHSLGAEIINQYPEYFYEGAEMLPADEVFQRELVEQLLRAADHTNPLRKGIGSEFSQLATVCSVLDTVKKAGLSPPELSALLDEVEAQIHIIEPMLASMFSQKLSMKSISDLEEAILAFPTSPTIDLPIPFRSVSEVISESLILAIRAAIDEGKTAPIGAWRIKWMLKDAEGSWSVLKERTKLTWWRAIAALYLDYEQALQQAHRFDFADMIIKVISVLEEQPTLRAELQERWQYIMIDEFQDTNAAQTRLAHLIADHPVHEGNPNILVVGDDDQGIFKFQGAELDNITRFIQYYPKSKVITLNKNYRSHEDVIAFSRSIIGQAEDRLEKRIKSVKKHLTQANQAITRSERDLLLFDSQAEESAWIAESIKERLKNGEKASEITVIARTHAQLQKLVPFLEKNAVPFSYERQADIRESDAIRQIIAMLELVVALGKGDKDTANAALARVVSHPMWRIDHISLWQWSSSAHRQLVDAALLLDESDPIRIVTEWFVKLGSHSGHVQIETMLDRLIGTTSLEEVSDMHSPFRDYYFSDTLLKENPQKYIAELSALRLFRTKLREYAGTEQLIAADALKYLEVLERTHARLIDETPFVTHADAVQLLTVHKAKGLEFQTVYIIGALEELWAKTGASSNRYLKTVPIGPPGDQLDDFVRLMFVAVTRAQSSLVITAFRFNDAGGRMQPLIMLGGEEAFRDTTHAFHDAYLLETSWHDYHPLPTSSDEAVLKPLLDTYRLSVTHLLNFLNVAEAGPKYWLLTNLLEFPQMKEPFFAYGTAMHRALEQGLVQYKTGHKPSTKELIELFEIALQKQLLEKEDFTFYLKQGTEHLKQYHKQRMKYWDTHDIPELDFAHQNVEIDNVRLSGKIDRLHMIDKKTVAVIDIKTGSPLKTWGRNTGTDGMKTWKYALQLQFYKILVEHSRDYSQYIVGSGELEFTQPDEHDTLHVLGLDLIDFDATELRSLIGIVWGRMQRLELPDTSGYGDDVSANKQFVQDLLDGTI